MVAGVPLGSIVAREFIDAPQLVVLSHSSSPLAERYRRVLSKLELIATRDDKPPQQIMITSSVPREGKTTTAINLALAMAEAKDRKILLVDGDLRAPSVGSFIKPLPQYGLSEVLSGTVPLAHALIEVKTRSKGAKLTVLSAGSPVKNPVELLHSQYATKVFEELRGQFDRIVLDTTPLLPFSDPYALKSHCDGVLLVVRARSTAKSLIERAVESLEGWLLGVVLNDVKITPIDRYYYPYEDYYPDRYADEPGGSGN